MLHLHRGKCSKIYVVLSALIIHDNSLCSAVIMCRPFSTSAILVGVVPIFSQPSGDIFLELPGLRETPSLEGRLDPPLKK